MGKLISYYCSREQNTQYFNPDQIQFIHVVDSKFKDGRSYNHQSYWDVTFGFNGGQSLAITLDSERFKSLTEMLNKTEVEARHPEIPGPNSSNLIR